MVVLARAAQMCGPTAGQIPGCAVSIFARLVPCLAPPGLAAWQRPGIGAKPGWEESTLNSVRASAPSAGSPARRHGRARAPLVWLSLCLGLALGTANARSAEPAWTEQERDWIARHPVLRLATSADYGPFTFTDADGRVRGLSMDYVERLQQLTGLRIEAQPPAPFSTNLHRLAQGEVDLIMSLRDTPERRRDFGFTRPYVSVPAVLVRRRDMPRDSDADLRPGEAVAVSRGYAVAPFLAERYADNPQQAVADDKQLLRAVSSGDVPAGVLDLAGATYLLRTQGIGNLRIVGDVGFSYDLGIGYRRDWPLLGRILDKALSQISAEERQAMADRWFMPPHDRSAERRLLQAAVLVLVLAAAGLALVLLWNRALRRQVAQRSAALEQSMNEQLRLQGVDQARALAEAANRAKSQFMSQASHELRTPLNAVMGYAQLLQIDPAHALDAEQRRRVGHIEDAARHLLVLIDDMMNLSRLDAGTLSLNVQPISLSGVLARCLALAAPAAKDQALELRCCIEQPDQVALMADPVRLEQVLHNLISNAIKYNREGGWVELRLAPSQDGWVCLEVADSGIGLTPEQQEQLFQPFNRLGRSHVEGTGIGLVICKQLVERMGGTIRVSSRPTEGSIFSLQLPQAAA